MALLCLSYFYWFDFYFSKNTKVLSIYFEYFAAESISNRAKKVLNDLIKS